MCDTLMFEGILMIGVHCWEDCQRILIEGYYQPKARPCVIHRPSPHHMRLWPLTWRNDRGIFERHCPHGVGHPDPDQFDFWAETGREYEAAHGCDGCCQAPLPMKMEGLSGRSSEQGIPVVHELQDEEMVLHGHMPYLW